MTTKGIVLLSVLSLLSSAALAQTGRVIVTGDVAVNEMVSRHVELNNRVKTMPGYRVQIASFSGINSKTSAFNLRERFMTDYPTVQAYIVYDEPNFKVKVGDFRSRPMPSCRKSRRYTKDTSSRTTSMPNLPPSRNTPPTTRPQATNSSAAMPSAWSRPSRVGR